MIITVHARERWVERINPALTPDQAADAISCHERVIDAAAAFGCQCVRLANGARLVLKGDVVTTVLAKSHRPKAMLRRYEP